MCWAIHKRAHPKQMVPSLEDPRTKRVEHALTVCGARQVKARAISPIGAWPVAPRQKRAVSELDLLTAGSH